MKNPQVIEEYSNEETLVMVVVEEGTQDYGVIVESKQGVHSILTPNSFIEAQEIAKSLVKETV